MFNNEMQEVADIIYDLLKDNLDKLDNDIYEIRGTIDRLNLTELLDDLENKDELIGNLGVKYNKLDSKLTSINNYASFIESSLVDFIESNNNNEIVTNFTSRLNRHRDAIIDLQSQIKILDDLVMDVINEGTGNVGKYSYISSDINDPTADVIFEYK